MSSEFPPGPLRLPNCLGLPAAGGTTLDAYRVLAAEIQAEWEALLLDRIRQYNESTSVDAARLRVYTRSSRLLTWVEWDDDPEPTGYWIGHGLEHHPRRAPDQLPAFATLSYVDLDDVYARPGDPPKMQFGPPHARDLALHLDVLWAWLLHHRRAVLVPAWEAENERFEVMSRDEQRAYAVWRGQRDADHGFTGRRFVNDPELAQVHRAACARRLAANEESDHA